MIKPILWFFMYYMYPEIEVYSSEHSVFPSVNIWVCQQGTWKQHPCNSNARITFIFGSLKSFSLFPIYSLFLIILYSPFILYSLYADAQSVLKKKRKENESMNSEREL